MVIMSLMLGQLYANCMGLEKRMPKVLMMQGIFFL